MATLYTRDFYAWTQQQADAVDRKQFVKLDSKRLAGEIREMGGRERKSLENRVRLLMMHLLKWQFQRERRAASWEATIRVQTRSVVRELKQMPSLRSVLRTQLADLYLDAVDLASAETSIPLEDFPAECPFRYEDLLQERFYRTLE